MILQAFVVTLKSSESGTGDQTALQLLSIALLYGLFIFPVHITFYLNL